MPPRSPSFAPQLWLLSMNLVWGISYSAVKYVLDRGMPPFAMMTARFWLAVAVLAPFVVHRRDALVSEAKRGIATGLSLLLGYVLQTLGMQQTTASMAGFLSGLITLLVALGGVLVFRERLHRATVLGLLLGVVGLVLMSWPDAGRDQAGKDSMLGVMLLIAASVSFACHILMMSKWSRNGRETVYCWWQLVTVALGTAAFLPFQGGLAPVLEYALDPSIAGCIVYLAVFALALAIVVQSRVQPRIKATQVAVIFATQPLFGALGGMGLMGDRLGTAQWIGGGLIVGGVLVAELLRETTNPA
jgi:drug/metabolite transporter (DMT)-like permease